MEDITRLVQFLMDFAPRGEPLDLGFLAEYGVTSVEASHLVTGGWLRRLSDDAYLL
ncbi:hypothetical protein [Paraburkholderia sp. BL25I1N1]|uniref:hypothetical protein n=1 Tax=Paraburkholderia sp. BL25I1N1 TaxID=1938804 RepID=UPI000D3F9A5D|nr:hypothetical protein [Paraburkholderia sp. BL25I1N1]PRY04404.1 hypothetical protein B0G73_11280 [Paraburkholderia sp. BL25I1N1]